MKRLYPAVVSFVGASGLAAALSYFVGVYLSFQPEWRSWATFFVPKAVALLVVPYVLLLGYLYLRTQLGDWFLSHGYVEEAIARCEQRLDQNLARSRKEALINRVTLARAYVHRADYERARQVLDTGYAKPTGGAQSLDIHRWLMECALRTENLVHCHQAFDSVAEQARPKRARAYVLACRAELAAREGARAEFDEAIDQARWLQPDNPRVVLAEVLGALRFRAEAADDAQALADDMLADLDEIGEAIVAEIPGRQAELLALRAEVLYTRGDTRPARQLIEHAAQARSDTRSEYQVRRVRELIEAS